MSARFVILHHTGYGDEHWDLMLEAGESLWTWQLAADPTSGLAKPISARRIGHHRKLYLDYEGPVSGGRGHVRRVDRGTFDLISQAPIEIVLQLHGRRWSGTARLRQREANWILERI